MAKILIVDDEQSIRESFSLILGDKYQLLLAASGEVALKHVTDQKIDLAYLDIRMPDLNGLETLQRIKAIDPSVEVIMVTAVNDVQKASLAIKYGARDYIIKPFDVKSILKITETILRRKALLSGKRPPRIIGQSEKISALIKTIGKLDPKISRLLILGESGTEKEELAAYIHEHSPRAEFPFRSIDLSSKISPAAISTKLFGKGTGSTTADLKKLPGLLDEVRGGTLFINNASRLPSALLSSLPADSLIIGGGLADLAERSKEIFDYFSEVQLTLPPLRERISDIPLLLNHYLEIYNKEYGREIEGFSAEADDLLANHPWPGNTAELQALVRLLVIRTGSDKITPADLPFEFTLKISGFGAEYLAKFEKEPALT